MIRRQELQLKARGNTARSLHTLVFIRTFNRNSNDNEDEKIAQTLQYCTKSFSKDRSPKMPVMIVQGYITFQIHRDYANLWPMGASRNFPTGERVLVGSRKQQKDHHPHLAYPTSMFGRGSRLAGKSVEDAILLAAELVSRHSSCNFQHSTLNAPMDLAIKRILNFSDIKTTPQ